MEKISVSDFLDNQYKDFAMSVIEDRAIPSVIDGFKPSQRKIICAANNIWKNGNEKSLKVFQLSGIVASDMYYHHGSQSLDSAIINMAQEFKNNVPLFERMGQFGTLRSQDSGASRYIGVKLSKTFRYVYKDFDLLEMKYEDGEAAEYKVLLPTIPMVLINGTYGLAVGFSSLILNRNPNDIINACLTILKGKHIKENNIKPCINGFNGVYIQDSNNNKKWYIRGIIERINTTTIKVSELPVSLTYEKYDEILDSLIENKMIVSYEDNCRDNIDYTIKFNRNALSTMTDDDIIKLLKLEETTTEIFSTLDENGKLMIFENIADIITYFVNYRLSFYDKRKDLLIKKIEKELLVLSNKLKFIKAIIDGDLVINNVSKMVLTDKMTKMSFDKIDNTYDYLLKMPIYSLTKELYNKLKEDKDECIVKLNEIKNKMPKDMYIEDLNELKKNLKI